MRGRAGGLGGFGGGGGGCTNSMNGDCVVTTLPLAVVAEPCLNSVLRRMGWHEVLDAGPCQLSLCQRHLYSSVSGGVCVWVGGCGRDICAHMR